MLGHGGTATAGANVASGGDNTELVPSAHALWPSVCVLPPGPKTLTRMPTTCRKNVKSMRKIANIVHVDTEMQMWNRQQIKAHEDQGGGVWKILAKEIPTYYYAKGGERYNLALHQIKINQSRLWEQCNIQKNIGGQQEATHKTSAKQEQIDNEIKWKAAFLNAKGAHISQIGNASLTL